MLLISVSLESGYPGSSIRERIYTVPDVGYGTLLFTGTSDPEGTLGDLIQVGRRIHEHVRNALEMDELCSNDPVCAQHGLANQHDRRFLLGAACHGCLLISESSSVQHTEFLDRSLVVPTVDEQLHRCRPAAKHRGWLEYWEYLARQATDQACQAVSRTWIGAERLLGHSAVAIEKIPEKLIIDLLTL